MINTPLPPVATAPAPAEPEELNESEPGGLIVFLLASAGPMSLLLIVGLVIGALVLVGHQVSNVFSNITPGLNG
jgi:hypothetical protein